jgi:hypothetical protein
MKISTAIKRTAHNCHMSRELLGMRLKRIMSISQTSPGYKRLICADTITNTPKRP